MKEVILLIRSLCVFLASIALATVLLPIGIVYGFVIDFWKHRLKTGLHNAERKLFALAAAVDKYGNVACKELFNDTLIHRGSEYKFGKIHQTISAVIGFNLKVGALRKPGRWLNKILDLFEKDHSLKAAQSVPICNK